MMGKRTATSCDKAPEGWRCTREYGHDGPCAAVRALTASQKLSNLIEAVYTDDDGEFDPNGDMPIHVVETYLRCNGIDPDALKEKLNARLADIRERIGSSAECAGNADDEVKQ